MKKVLVLGASGATGKLLVQQLLLQNINVVAIVRNANSFRHEVGDQPKLNIVEASIADISDIELARHVQECDAVCSCLGHNLTLKGMFGQPRLLVTNAMAKITQVIESIKPDKVIKIILMNTTGNSNRDIPEKPPLSQRCVISLLRYVLPPHSDNENAADFLRIHIAQNHPFIEWTAVRPDSLTHEQQVSDYDTLPSPTKNAIFDSAPTSRINVANFMANLITNPELWAKWKGKMPVIYNKL